MVLTDLCADVAGGTSPRVMKLPPVKVVAAVEAEVAKALQQDLAGTRPASLHGSRRLTMGRAS